MQRNYPTIDKLIFCVLGVMVLITCIIAFVKYIVREDFRYITHDEDIPAALDLRTY
jgi:hypothetical protein